jgi:hypothetical protein
MYSIVGKRGEKGAGVGPGKGPKMGQLTLSKRPARMRVSSISHATFVIYFQYEKNIFLPV